MSDINDKFTYVALGTKTGLDVQKEIGAASIQCDDLDAWQDAAALSAVFFAIDRVDLNNERVPGTYTEWKGLVSGNTIGSLQLKEGTDQVYPADSFTRVYMVITSAWANSFIAGILTSFAQTGKLKAGAIDNSEMFAAGILTSVLAGENLSLNDLSVTDLSVAGDVVVTGTSRMASVSVASATSGVITPTKQLFNVTALAAAAQIANPTWTPHDNMVGTLRIKDDGTARGLTWGNKWLGISEALPSATIAGKYMFIVYEYIAPPADRFAVLSIARQA